MERIPLSEFVKENSQEKAASLIGFTKQQLVKPFVRVEIFY